MKLASGLLLIAVLALSTSGAHFLWGSAAHAGDRMHADPVMVAECDSCTAEQMQSGVDRCGPACASPALDLAAAPALEPASEPVARAPETGAAVAGQIRRPEPNPPRFS